MKEPEDVTKIKDAIRACRTVADVHAIADHYRPQVAALKASQETRVFAHQISNLKSYMIQVNSRHA